jgi:dTDP-4-dehydrorhamnose 3,5-epimerase
MKNDQLMRGIQLICPKIHRDERGWFYEAYNNLDNKIDVVFLQDNHSFSKKKGTVRGLHLQLPPYEQSKLVRVLRGSILDIVVDLRKDSESYLSSNSILLDSIDKKALFIPKGFAHGFVTLEDNTEVYYKVDNTYSVEHEITIRFDDSELGIHYGDKEDFIISEKDKNGMSLQEAILKLGLK